jgi:hypothetical protein
VGLGKTDTQRNEGGEEKIKMGAQNIPHMSIFQENYYKFKVTDSV